MDLELLGSLGWREGLIAIIGLLLVYIIVLYLRMRRLRQAVAVQPPLAAQAAVAAYSAVQGPATPASVPFDPPAPTEALTAGAAQAAPAQAETAQPVFAWNEPPAEIPGQARLDALQRELQALRREVDELRVAVQEAREDCRQHLAVAPPQDASPRYKDAMQMAIEGQDATSIANHCGIARAEADLVVALARNRRRSV